MSISNLWYTKDHGVIVTDSAIYNQAGEVQGFGQKLHHLEHHRSVISHRGNIGYMLTVMGVLSSVPLGGDSFDDIAEFLPTALKIADEHGDAPHWLCNEVLLFGYSRKAGGMLAVEARRRVAGEPYKYFWLEREKLLLSPLPPGWACPPVNKQNVAAVMKRAAIAQAEYAKQLRRDGKGNDVVGGVITMTTLDKNGATTGTPLHRIAVDLAAPALPETQKIYA
jgi:hypothetical protein